MLINRAIVRRRDGALGVRGVCEERCERVVVLCVISDGASLSAKIGFPRSTHEAYVRFAIGFLYEIFANTLMQAICSVLSSGLSNNLKNL